MIYNISRGKSISDKLHSETSITNFEGKTVPYENWPDAWKRIHYKEYARFNKIHFDKSIRPLKASLWKILLTRKSNREFSRKKLSLVQLQQILFYSAGINTFTTEDKASFHETRVWPSAGARYPIEIYIMANKVESLRQYSYHYNVKRNLLEELFEIDNYAAIVEAITNQEWAKKSAALIILSSIFDRTRIKYGDRGYRYCLLEAGHIGQNVYLASNAMGVKCCAIGGFCEHAINNHLELDGLSESPIYILAIGN